MTEEEIAKKYIIEKYGLKENLQIWEIKLDEDLSKEFYAYIEGYHYAQNTITQCNRMTLGKQLTDKDKQIEELKKTCTELSDNNFKEVAKLEDEIRSKDNQIAELEAQIDYAKSIIKSLLDNSDEYAEQRARDFLKETECN